VITANIDDYVAFNAPDFSLDILEISEAARVIIEEFFSEKL
jgi:hypothetical protein